MFAKLCFFASMKDD